MKRKIIVFILFCWVISGCTASKTTVQPEKGQTSQIKVRSQVNGQVYIEPIFKGQNFIFIKISDPTEHAGLKLAQHLKTALSTKGYQITQEPQKANYIMQGRVISSGEIKPELLEAAYSSPYGSRIRSFEQSKRPDLIADTIGFLARQAGGKKYAIVMDIHLSQNIKISPRKIKTDRSMCRLIIGSEASHLPVDQAMIQLREKFKSHIAAYF